MTKGLPRLLLAAMLAASVPASAGIFERDIRLVSQTRRGFSAEGRSEGAMVNANGLVVTYNSNALDLVSPPLQSSRTQIYVREIEATASVLVSRNAEGQPGNQPSMTGGFSPGINGDGSVIAFSSRAGNLVPDDTNGIEDVFVADRTAGTIELISRGLDGPANGASSFPRVSADGRYVVFQSRASNLVEGDENGTSDIFVYDRDTATLRLVSVGLDGAPANDSSITPAISDDGRVIAFASRATNLVEGSFTERFERIYVVDWQDGAIELASVSTTGTPGNRISFLPDLTADGGQVAFKSEAFNLVPNDTNGVPDVFVRDRGAGTTERVSVDSFGNQGNGLSGGPGISGDGRFVAFVSFASNFVPDDGNGFSDVYVYDRFPPDRDQGLIARVTIAINDFGEPNEGVPDFPVSISSDGRWIAFSSSASNLVPNDLNNDVDVFLACNPFDAFACAPPTPIPTVTETPTPEPPGDFPCIGDCNGDGEVTIDDLIRMVNIALGLRPVCGEDGGVGQCLAGDADCDCEITVDEIIRAVNNTLFGCHQFGSCTLAEHEAACCEVPLPTPTATFDGETPTPTPTPPGGDTPTTTVTGDDATPTATGSPGPVGPCIGDCDGNGEVTIADLIRMVNIALELQPLCAGAEGEGCLAGDANCDCAITVDEIIRAVNNALSGCTQFGTCDVPAHEAQCCAG